MSLWEFAACVEGYAKAHGPDDKPKPPTPEEHLAMVEKAKSRRR